MTPQTVMQTHRKVFLRSLLEQDWESLAQLYADDYILIRSDSSVLTKGEVLADLRAQSLVFKTINLTEEKVRIVGSAAILTGRSETRSLRDGVLSTAEFRFVAVYSELPLGLKLVHFQSTTLPKQSDLC